MGRFALCVKQHFGMGNGSVCPICEGKNMYLYHKTGYGITDLNEYEYCYNCTTRFWWG